ncbi:MAG: cytochrome P450 [Pikeienuella sp.]
MGAAPIKHLDMAALWDDPYPQLDALREAAPIAFVPELNGVVITRLADISVLEKQIDIFSSHQPDGLMVKLMGHNLMRKDGADHMVERRAIFPAVSPRTVADKWKAGFEADADALLDAMTAKGFCDLVQDYALPLSGHALRRITGLMDASYADIDRWSQAMMDGIANYAGAPEPAARCAQATIEMDAMIEATAAADTADESSLLAAQMRADLPMDSVKANIKLAISGGQNEPRDVIAGAVWALLSHPDQLAKVKAGAVTWPEAMAEYVRWISPIGMSPRRIAKDCEVLGADLTEGTMAFLMFGAANRDQAVFEAPDNFDVTRDASKHIAFGAGPHFCAGAWASKALISEVALPRLFARFPDLRLADGATRFVGWAFRGPLAVNVEW